jgi:LPS O-antigen subunit length determinant protein (WzzB/FepE family)
MIGILENSITFNIYNKMETPTTEQVQNHIRAAFDSVNLINKEIEKEVTDNIKDNVEINIQHLELMLSKDWFEAGCTTQQVTDINAAITAGKAYIA